MKKKLPINVKSIFKSYVHHSYPHAIVDREDIATLYVKGIGEWSGREADVVTECDIESELLYIKESMGRTATDYVLERMCKKNDEIIVKIKSIKLMDATSYVKLSMKSEEGESFAFHWNQYDITVGSEHYLTERHFDSYYRVKKEEDVIHLYVSPDLDNWSELFAKRFEDKTGNLKFEIRLYFGDNQYEQWINMNYIQLFLNINDVNTVYLDYFIFPRKNDDASFQQLCQFLDTEYIDFQKWMTFDYERLHDFVASSIENGAYLNVCLNEYWIPNRHLYKKNRFDHYNLIYGYDDDKREYNILGYDLKGKLVLETIPFETLEKSIVSKPIVRYIYRVNKYAFKFQVEYVIEMLEEFLNGNDSSKRFSGILTASEGTYGINIFSELLEKEEGKRLLLKDKRISFLLYEHSKLMLSRLHYLCRKGYIGQDDCRILINQCNEVVIIAEKLKNQVIMNRISENMEQVICNTLLKLKNEVYDFGWKLVSCLRKS